MRLLAAIRSKTPCFSGMVPTLLRAKTHRSCGVELLTLLAKGAIERSLQPRASQASTAFTYSSPKKDDGLRPILDLRHLNRALMKRLFRMITLKQILSQIRIGDWFFFLDLKDAYFHIQIAPITDDSCDSPSREWLISTRSFPWTVSAPPPPLLRSAWTWLSPL